MSAILHDDVDICVVNKRIVVLNDIFRLNFSLQPNLFERINDLGLVIRSFCVLCIDRFNDIDVSGLFVPYFPHLTKSAFSQTFNLFKIIPTIGRRFLLITCN